MSSSAEALADTAEPDPFEPALIAVLREAREQRASAGRAVELRAVIRALYARMSPRLKPKYAQEVQEAWERHDRGVNGGPVFEKVTRLLFDANTQKRWTAKEVCSAIGGSDPKPVFNVLAYLVRANRIRRIERGQYLVPKDGVMIVTSDELDGEPSHYDFE